MKTLEPYPREDVHWEPRNEGHAPRWQAVTVALSRATVTLCHHGQRMEIRDQSGPLWAAKAPEQREVQEGAVRGVALPAHARAGQARAHPLRKRGGWPGRCCAGTAASLSFPGPRCHGATQHVSSSRGRRGGTLAQ